MKKTIFILFFLTFIFTFSMIYSQTTTKYLSSTDEIQYSNSDIDHQALGNSRAFSAPVGSIFTQLPHYPKDGWSFATSEIDPGYPIDYTVAENFWGLGSQLITGARFWGMSNVCCWDNCISENPMTFEFTFYQDNSYAVGSIVSQFTATPTMTLTDSLYGGYYYCYEFDITFPDPVIMPEGWISIQGQNDSPNCWFLWASSFAGDFDSYQHTDIWSLTGFDRGICLIGMDMTPPDPLAGSGRCLEFDGVNEYVEIIGESDFDFTTEMSVEGWFNVSTFDRTWQALVTKGDNSWRIHRYGTTDYLAFGTNHGEIYSTTNVNDGEWHHFAAVFAESTKYLYIDGILEATQTGLGPISTGDYPVLIGENAQSTNRYFEGDIDEVRIWDTARSETEIRDNMCKKQTGSESGLVGYWRFDESSGLYTWDDSGNVHHGILKNMEDPDDHVWSGAPLGNFSSASYPAPPRDSREIMSADIDPDRMGIAATYYYSGDSGFQIYWISEAPNTDNMCGYLDTLSTVMYFGFFRCGGTVAYDFRFNYEGHPEIGAECTYDLARRANNAEMMWDQAYAIQDMAENNLHLFWETGTEFILGASENLYYTCSDTIAYDTEWCDIDTVFVGCDVIVPDSISLTICEDIIVKFMHYGGPFGPEMYVYGDLYVNGSSGNLVTFTAQDNSSIWGGIHFIGDATPVFTRSQSSLINYAIIEYCDNMLIWEEFEAAVSAYNYPNLEVSNSIIRYNYGRNV